MSNERRRHERRDFQYFAYVDCGAQRGLVRCLFLDVSAGGARLRVPDARYIPDRMELLFSPSMANGRVCTVAWRRGREVGIRFVKPPSLEPLAAPGIG